MVLHHQMIISIDISRAYISQNATHLYSLGEAASVLLKVTLYVKKILRLS